MKPSLLALVALSVSTLSCQSWINTVEQNPAEVASEMAQVVSSVITTAELVFGSVKPSLPAATQASDQALLDQAIAVLEHATTALEDSVQAAIDAKTTTVANFAALETAVQSAVDAVVATIDAIRGVDAGAMSMAGASPYADLKVQQSIVKRIH